MPRDLVGWKLITDAAAVLFAEQSPGLFAVFAPFLFTFYQAQMALLANFAHSVFVFAACTFNFGPRAIMVPHLDFGNLSWGWCVITVLGDFDPNVGRHLILWDLKLVVRFPPGSTILIPSAIVYHSNVPVAQHEQRFSFTQYTTGGLFRWVRNSFRTDKVFVKSVMKGEQMCAKEAEKRWEEDVGMYSTVDSASSE
ncbi:hypothetical protein DFH09DRAFT_1249300 [Mycena vulgaris]|nr:hypothetical protein DFH09DRAFT_1249300 [Mycena vulgaris]